MNPGRRAGILGEPGRWAAAVIAAGALARLWRLGSSALGFDEAMSLKWAEGNTLREVWGIGVGGAPAFNDAWNALLHFWLGAGTSPAAARALPALAGVAALWLGWKLLGRMLAPWTAVAALSLFAFSPFGVQYAQEARQYSLVLACELGTVWALMRAVDTGSWKAWGAWTALSAAAGVLHLVALSWTAAAVVYVGLMPGRRHRLAQLAGWGLLAAAPAVALAVADARTIARVDSSGYVAAGAGGFLVGVGQFFGPSAWAPAFLVDGALAGWAVVVAAGLALAVAPAGSGAEGRRLRAAILAFGIVPLAALLAANWTGLLYRPKPRYALGSQLFLIAAAARAISAMPARGLRVAAVAAFLAVDGAALANYWRGGVPTLDLPPCRKPFHEVAADLVSRSLPGDAVLSVEFQTYLPLDRYLAGRLPHGYVARDPSFSDAELAVLGRPVDAVKFIRTHRRVWVISAPAAWTPPTDVPADVLPLLSRAGRMRREMLRPGIRVQCWEAR